MTEKPRTGPFDTETATRLETLVEAGPEDSGQLSLEVGEALELGNFRIIRELGHGGMGRVFLARQTAPVERDVALKLIRNRVINRTTLARFEVERQALAQMQHPAIAQVHDAGTTPQGYPYFAMEYVDGEPLDRFLRRHRLSLRDRMDLFVRICQGVQHAHQRGIIHRDLKPANVLVTLIDGIPSPKIIDFGIATASRRDDDDPTRTRDVIGTPEYMSPEQFADGDGIIDTRSDVYSLGVLLYEILTDRPPVEPGKLRTDNRPSFQAATGGQPPPRPSTRLAEETGSREEIARRRKTRYRSLMRSLRGDLDAITLKAMQVERDNRYSSPAELADDIVRYLACRPVRARAPTRAYTLARFVRRNALALGSASAVLLALVAGLAAATLGMLEAQRQYERAELRQRELEQVAGFQQSMLEQIDANAMGLGIIDVLRQQYLESAPGDPDPDRFEQVAARSNATDLAREVLHEHLLQRAADSIASEFADQPLLQADLYRAVFEVYRSIGLAGPQPELARNILALRQQVLPESDLAVMRARYHLASAYFSVGDFEQARTELERISASLSADRPDGQAALIKARDLLAMVLVELGEREEAVALARSNLDFARSTDALDRSQLLDVYGNLGYVQARSGQLEAALENFRQQLDGQREMLDSDDPELAAPMTNVAAALAALGRESEALAINQETLALLERTLGRRHPYTLRVMNNLANTLRSTGETEQAIELLEDTVALRREVMGPDHPLTLRAMLNLASVFSHVGRHDPALELIDTVVEKRRALLGDDHLDTLMAQELRANVLLDMGESQAGFDIIAPVYQARREMLGPGHAQTQAAGWLLGRARLALDDPASAEPLIRASLEHMRERRGPESAPALQMAVQLYRALVQQERFEEADAVRSDYLAVLDSEDPDSMDDSRRELYEALTEITSSASR